MPLLLSPATEADMPSIVRAQYAAFHPNDAMHMLLWPSPHPVPESVISSTVERQLEYWRTNPSVTWLKTVDTETGEVVAAAKWIIWDEIEKDYENRFSGSVDVSWIEEGLMEGESGNVGKGVDDKEFVKWVMEEFFGRRRERLKGPAVLLDMCFTAPSHHRRGAGKSLVEWGIKKADELGVKGFVESSYTGRRLYESCGFESREHVVLNGGKIKEEWSRYGDVSYHWMERDARVKKT